MGVKPARSIGPKIGRLSGVGTMGRVLAVGFAVVMTGCLLVGLGLTGFDSSIGRLSLIVLFVGSTGLTLRALLIGISLHERGFRVTSWFGASSFEYSNILRINNVPYEGMLNTFNSGTSGTWFRMLSVETNLSGKSPIPLEATLGLESHIRDVCDRLNEIVRLQDEDGVVRALPAE